MRNLQMTAAQANQMSHLVERHIPREWRGDLRVEHSGELARTNGRPAGTPYVRLSARTKLARVQAMISIGPFAQNAPAEWHDCWKRGADGRWYIDVYCPSNAVQHGNIFEQH